MSVCNLWEKKFCCSVQFYFSNIMAVICLKGIGCPMMLSLFKQDLVPNDVAAGSINKIWCPKLCGCCNCGLQFV